MVKQWLIDFIGTDGTQIVGDAVQYDLAFIGSVVFVVVIAFIIFKTIILICKK